MLSHVAGRPILAHTLSVFQDCDAIDNIVVVTGDCDIEAVGEISGRFGFDKVSFIVAGGSQRQQSVANGLRHVTGDLVAIHDAARPLVTRDLLLRCLQKAAETGAAIAAVPVIDTIKSIEGSRIRSTVDREALVAVQTPQVFRKDLIRTGHERAAAEGFLGTDDAALLERLGYPVSVVDGSYDNIKITTPSDARLAEMRLGGGEVRTGIGYDVHAFAQGRRLVLGGVEIEHEMGLAGHSDADVVLHAIADACLGAAALGDIGRLFPDNDPSYSGISSLVLLGRVAEALRQAGWSVVNVDVVVICQRPRIAPHSAEMARRIGDCLGVEAGRISIKGTTTEGLGFTGRQEGIACQAVAALSR